MATIYYKNSQTNNFIPITYKDFNAASMWHTHTWNDIKVYDYDTNEEIEQVLSPLDGGCNVERTIGTSAGGIYTINTSYPIVKQIPATNGVLGLYSNNNYPSFQAWPVIAGGTGSTSREQAMKKFSIAAPQIIPLDFKYTSNAYLSNNNTQIRFSIDLPYQLLPNTTGEIELYARFITQNNINAASSSDFQENIDGTKYIYGFAAHFNTSAGQEGVTTTNCLKKYGYTATEGATAEPYGTIGEIGNPLGSVTVWTFGANIDENENGKLTYIDGSIITIEMTFDEALSTLANNWPVLILDAYVIGYSFNNDTTKILHNKITLY